MLTEHTKNIVALLLGSVVAVVLFEGLCQAYYYSVLKPSFDAQRSHPSHFYRASASPELGYELAPETVIDREGSRIRINSQGIRADRDDLSGQSPRIGLLGDSVAFGFPHTQEQTPSQLLEALLTAREGQYVVLNFGTPGYSIPEIEEFFRQKEPIYSPDYVYFILNANDFMWRNTLYEGADDGLYRMYNPPAFKGLWFIRKLIYRLDKFMGPGLYARAFRITRDRSLEIVRRMKSYADAQGIRFTVVLLPHGAAYTAGQYALADMNAEIAHHLTEVGIDLISLVDAFGENPDRLYDETDHLTVEGNAALVEEIYAHWREHNHAVED